MSDLLPQVIPVDEIKTTTEHVTSDDGHLKEAINTAAEPVVDAFEGDDDIIREEIKEELDKEEEEDLKRRNGRSPTHSVNIWLKPERKHWR